MPFFKQCLNTEFAHSITYSWISQNFHAKLVSHTLARLRTLPHDRPLRTDTRRAFVCQFYTAKVFFFCELTWRSHRRRRRSSARRAYLSGTAKPSVCRSFAKTFSPREFGLSLYRVQTRITRDPTARRTCR